MKKWTSTSLGGAPADGDDLLDVFNSEIWEAMQSIFSPYDADLEGIIVSGCVISGSGPYDMSAGIVYLNGEFQRMQAITGMTLPQYIQHDTPVNDNRTFADTTVHTVAVTKSVKIDSSPGSGQNINITTTTDPDDRRWNPASQLDLSSAVAVEATNRTNADNTEASTRAAADALKANKAQSSWSNLTLTNGWASVSGSTVQYRVDEFGKVNLRGQLDGTASTGLVFTTSLPTSVKQNRISTLRSNSSVIQASQFTVSTSGQGQSIFGSGDDIIFLDGISYWVD